MTARPPPPLPAGPPPTAAAPEPVAIIDVPGTSWAAVWDAATGKYYYANKDTFEVDWNVPQAVVEARAQAMALLAATQPASPRHSTAPPPSSLSSAPSSSASAASPRGVPPGRALPFSNSNNTPSTTNSRASQENDTRDLEKRSSITNRSSLTLPIPDAIARLSLSTGEGNSAGGSGNANQPGANGGHGPSKSWSQQQGPDTSSTMSPSSASGKAGRFGSLRSPLPPPLPRTPSSANGGGAGGSGQQQNALALAAAAAAMRRKNSVESDEGIPPPAPEDDDAIRRQSTSLNGPPSANHSGAYPPASEIRSGPRPPPLPPGATPGTPISAARATPPALPSHLLRNDSREQPHSAGGSHSHTHSMGEIPSSFTMVDTRNASASVAYPSSPYSSSPQVQPKIMGLSSGQYPAARGGAGGSQALGSPLSTTRSGPVGQLTFGPDGRLLSNSSAQAGGSGAHPMVFGPDGRLISGGAGGGATASPTSPPTNSPTPTKDAPPSAAAALAQAAAARQQGRHQSNSSTSANSSSASSTSSVTVSTSAEALPDGKHILPSPIKHDIHQFALKGFAAEHFRTFQKKTGFLSKAIVMDVTDVLSWQKKPIEKSLLTAAKKHSSEAVSVFKKILAFMGDSLESSKKNPTSLSAEIIQIGMKTPAVHDEIYCQLCKQTKLNPEPQSTLAGWKLMTLACASFPPTLNFQDHLMKYFQDNQHTPQEHKSLPSESQSISILARFCQWRMLKTISKGADEKFTLNHVEDYIKYGIKSYQVLFPADLEYIAYCQAMEKMGNFGNGASSSSSSSSSASNTSGVSPLVPDIMVQLCTLIRKAGGFSTKGIFRIAAQRDHIHALRARIESGSTDYSSDTTLDCHTPADVLKHWLRELLEPVVPKNLYDQALKVADDEAAAMKLIEKEMNSSSSTTGGHLRPAHYATLDYILTFLAELATQSKITMMTEDNLAIVFSQDLLKTDEKDPQVLLKNSNKEKNFIRALIFGWGKKIAKK